MQLSKQPRRPHYIEKWTRTKGWRQADLVRELGADKGIVSRWFAGATPGVEWQEKLAAIFSIQPEDLFSDPADRWFREFVRGRTDEEIEHIKRSLEVTFLRKLEK